MAEKLTAYNQKRNFHKTQEPEGKKQKQSGSKYRYVIQHHMARRDHFDLRLEWDGALISWAIPKGPSYNPADKRLAIKVEDHPLGYRNFEGTIPKGEYGGGTVMIWDEGYWEPLGDVNQSLKKGSLKFTIDGKRLKGKWALVCPKTQQNDRKDNWLLIKEKDRFSKQSTGITGFKTSVRTGRSMTQIEREDHKKRCTNPFQRADAQLAKLVDSVPKKGDWLYEIKYDGYRILAFIEKGEVRLATRNNQDYTKKFQEAAHALAEWAGDKAIIVDGEMVVMDADGRTDFQALQSYIKNPSDKNLNYMIFDILALDGEDLRDKPLIERKAILKKALAKAPAMLRYSAHIAGTGEETLKEACKLKLEGVIAKKADSAYSGTRNGDWVKIKCETRQEFVIGGYTQSSKRSNGISSVILGFFEDGKWKYAGRAGGFSESERKELEQRFNKIKRKTPPFDQVPKQKAHEKTVWISPKYVAEIRFAEWTKDGHLRQAVFKGLRSDKDAKSVKDEYAGAAGRKTKTKPSSCPTARPKPEECTVAGVRITSADRVIFNRPKVKKRELAEYYQKVAKRMLPYLENRLLSAIRCPKGVTGECFFKKHPDAGSKGIVRVPVSKSAGKAEDYFFVPDTTGLLSEVQMNTLEFHIWGSRADGAEQPDMVVFDLDPDEGMQLKKVRQGVRDLKKILDELSLVSFLKTSGGKGYHIVVPLKPSVGWEAFSSFAKNIARLMEQQWPERYTSNMRKEKRKGKIFIDWVRNVRGATSVAPYSVRARQGASVSMPIFWKELDTVSPGGIDIEEAVKRLDRKDPWANFFEVNQKITGLEL